MDSQSLKAARSRFLAYFVIVLVASCGLLYIALDNIVLSEFERLEKEEAQENLGSAIAALRRENAALVVWARDYAPWDDTLEFVRSGDLQYITTNFAPDTIENLGFDLILFLNQSGAVVWSYVAGPTSVGDLNVQDLPVLQLDGLEWDSSTGLSGLYQLTENGVYQIAAHPILTTDGKGPNGGSLIFGRRLDNRQFERIAASSIADFDLQPVGSDQAAMERVARIQSKFGGVDVARHQDRMSATTVLRDINDNPVLVLRVGAHRDMVFAGTLAIKNVMFIYVLVGLVTLLAGWLIAAQFARAPRGAK